MCPDRATVDYSCGRHGGGGSAFKASQASPHRYPDAIAAALHAGGGTAAHRPLATIARRDRRRSTPAASSGPFVHVPLAPTLIAVLRDERIDLLINTWRSVARVVVEAMAAGIPVVWQSLIQRRSHSSADGLPGALVRRHLSISPLSSRRQRPRRIRCRAAHFELRHHPSCGGNFCRPAASSAAPARGHDASLFLPAQERPARSGHRDRRRARQLQEDMAPGHEPAHAGLEDLNGPRQQESVIDDTITRPVLLFRQWSEHRPNRSAGKMRTLSKSI
jgi:hypothetical protein